MTSKPDTLWMLLSGEHLEDFIKAYESAFNERLTPEEANALFARLLHLYKQIKPVPPADDIGTDGQGNPPPAL